MKKKKNMLSSWFNIPVPDTQDARRRKLLNVILWALTIGALIVLVVVFFMVPSGMVGTQAEIEGLYLAIVLAFVGVVILYALNRYVSGELASTLFILLLLALAALSDEPQQVLTNLVTNAYQAMPDDGHLTITAALPSDHSPLPTP